MIQIRNLVREYGDFRLQVDITMGNSGITVLLGSSGSGKTTTLRMIGGFEAPDEGAILIDGQDITGVPVQKRNIGFVFQDYALFPHLSVGENIVYGLKARGITKVKRQNRLFQLLELTGLTNLEDRKITNLSGGEQQRVALARALAPEPRALLLDEPFSAVDPERREDLGRYLVELQAKISIPMVFVTHSRQEALSLGSRIIVLQAGRVVEEGSPNQLYENPRYSYTAKFLGKANIFTGEQWRSIGISLSGSTMNREKLYMARPEFLDLLGIGENRKDGFEIISRTYLGGRWEYQVQAGDMRIFARSVTEYNLGDRGTLGVMGNKLIDLEENQ